MSPEAIRGKLIGVLESIQLDSGLERPVLTGQSKPLEELPKFDSKVWPVAIALIAVELLLQLHDGLSKVPYLCLIHIMSRFKLL